MAKENKSVKNFPNLRFPGFDGQWEERKLEELIQIQSGYAFKSEYFIDNGNKLVIPKNFTKYGYGNFDDNISKFSQEQPPKQYKCKEGDLLILLTDLTPSCELLGKPLLLKKEDGEVWLNQRIIKLLIQDLKLKNWLFYYFQTEDYLKIIKETSTGSTVRHSSNKIINQLQIFIPNNPEEQQKISSLITLVDTRIQTQKKIIEDLIILKSNTAQNIFNRVFKFKDLEENDFPNWQIKKLGDVCEIKRGASPRPISDSKWFDEDSKIGWVRISDVTKSNKYLEKTEQYLSNAGISKSRLVKKGNMIMSICATIGKPIYTNFDVCIHDGFVVFENLTLDKEFLYYYLDFIQLNWYKYGQPGIQVNLNSEIVNNESVLVPVIEEQIKIADFLSKFDEKIKLENELLTQYENQKKYLLQNLFV